ncbi:MAG: MotA/TolQ/ExbB proton channel family protein [Gammaproteobacteria bacterium]|nr:MotA/TolQ/ExbB proton channel family protein [Gammaproteobacteria bacterium]
MWEIVVSGGWVMLPIILGSVVAVAIIGERFWFLQRKKICPADLVPNILKWIKNGQLDAQRIGMLRDGSPLGRILAAGLVNRQHGREVVKESIEDAGRHVVADLERYLPSLGMIASVEPLLGLLGTVFGMIQIFTVITTSGIGNPTVLAGGIAQALITTAAGLLVAIPTLLFYHYLRSRVEALVLGMEQEAIKLVEIIMNERENDIEAGRRK